MRIYLVGQARLKQIMKIYLASVESTGSLRQVLNDIYESPKNMKIFLAESGGLWGAYFNKENFLDTYILQSFYYADEFTEKHIIPNCKDFLLDSGAFSFCNGVKKVSKLDEYLKRYADFIKRNNVEKFFELDLDSIVGYEKVKEYRKTLEKLTGKQSIPVFHIERGKEEFLRHCDEYPYVALGGYVAAIKTNDPRQKAYVKAYPWFIDEAHKRGAQIHGLGFTQLTQLHKYHFDSVDSTAWTTGNRFGYLYYFDGRTIKKINAPKGHRISSPKAAAVNNFIEWSKFASYAERKF